MKTILNILLAKRNLSVASNLRSFMKRKKRLPNKTFWYFHASDHFEESTFRNETCDPNSSSQTICRKQLSDKLMNKSYHILSETMKHEFPLKTKLYLLDAMSVIYGSDHKNTIDLFDILRPQITFDLQKQNFFLLNQILYLSSNISTENKDDFNFLLNSIITKIEDHFLNEFNNDGQLCSTDIAVLCHSLFQLKAKFRSIDVLKVFTDIVSNDIECKRLSKSHVLSVVKYMRFNEYRNEKLIESVKQYVKTESTTFSFTECAHYLTFFANLSLYDEDVWRLIVDQKINQLLQNCCKSDNKTIRSKDLSRFLWCVSSMNYKLNQNIIDCSLKLMERLMSSDFKTYPHFLIDSFKSLIILGIYPQNLLIQSLDSKQWLKNMSNSERNKVSKDLYFILESIAIERPDIQFEKKFLIYSLAKELKHNVNQESKHRPKLVEYFNHIDHNTNISKTDFQFSYILKHIGIASIVVNGVSFEVIDSTVANHCHQLYGLMATKIRQMEAKNIPYFLINNLDDLKHHLTH